MANAATKLMKEWLIVVVSTALATDAVSRRAAVMMTHKNPASLLHSFDMAAKHCALALVLLVALQCTLAVAAVKKSVRFDFPALIPWHLIGSFFILNRQRNVLYLYCTKVSNGSLFLVLCRRPLRWNTLSMWPRLKPTIHLLPRLFRAYP
jgi:hypothetical protein